MAKKTPPPYSKGLIRERRAGNHPWRVDLTFSELWIKSETHTQIHVPADNYEPNKFDFTCVAGVGVRVKCSGIYNQDDLMRLAYELADVASPIKIEYESGATVDALEALWLATLPPLFKDDYQYKPDVMKLYSNSLQKDYDAREMTLLREWFYHQNNKNKKAS